MIKNNHRIERWLNLRSELIINKEICGFVEVYTSGPSDNMDVSEDTANIDRVYINAKYRDKGYANKLMDRALKSCIAHKIKLVTAHPNKAWLGDWLVRLGFKYNPIENRFEFKIEN